MTTLRSGRRRRRRLRGSGIPLQPTSSAAGPTAQASTGRAATSILTVFGLSIVEIWFAVPAGLALDVPPLVLWLATVAGSLLSVTIVAFAGDALRARLVRRRGGGVVAGRGRLYHVWVTYGVIGWGLASPLVFAPPMGTAIGLVLGAPRRRLLAAMAAGAVLWTTILVVAGVIGIDLIRLGLR